MPISQQQLDDVLESLIALTDVQPTEVQRDRLARLVLLLVERVGDVTAVRTAIEHVMISESQDLVLAIP